MCVQSCRSNCLNKYHEITCKTTRYKNSFFPDAIKSWNNIGAEFSTSNCIRHFKYDVNNLIHPKPRPVFRIRDPIGLKYLFQLRMGLSPLKSHKSRHKLMTGVIATVHLKMLLIFFSHVTFLLCLGLSSARQSLIYWGLMI